MTTKDKLDLGHIFEQLKEKNLNYRFETNDEEYRLSIINRQIYPRVWIDDFKNGATIIVETDQNLQERILMSDVDWIVRFSGTLDEIVFECTKWLIECHGWE